jgi:hypothetical protein
VNLLRSTTVQEFSDKNVRGFMGVIHFYKGKRGAGNPVEEGIISFHF